MEINDPLCIPMSYLACPNYLASSYDTCNKDCQMNTWAYISSSGRRRSSLISAPISKALLPSSHSIASGKGSGGYQQIILLIALIDLFSLPLYVLGTTFRDNGSVPSRHHVRRKLFVVCSKPGLHNISSAS
jgi:hypothetical protein